MTKPPSCGLPTDTCLPEVEVQINYPDGTSVPAAVLPNPDGSAPGSQEVLGPKRVYREATVEEHLAILQVSGPVASLYGRIKALENEFALHQAHLEATQRELAATNIAFEKAKAEMHAQFAALGLDGGDPHSIRRDGKKMLLLDAKQEK